MSGVALALEAMATRFELWLEGADPRRLRAAGEEAFSEVARAEAQLSRYRPTSQVAWINAAAGHRAVPVDGAVLRLLARCVEISRLTDGAFDPTVGPLLRAWGFVGGTGSCPRAGERERARALVGADRIEIDEGAGTVRLPRPGMELDLGAAGKGYAIDRAIAVLEEHGVTSALLHGGTSSVHVIGSPSESGTWPVAWRVPGGADRVRDLDASRPALSVSAAHGKGFSSPRGWQGHVLDPATGTPAQRAVSACVVGASSLLCDALSTAMLVKGPGWRAVLAARFPGYEGWAAAPPAQQKEAS